MKRPLEELVQSDENIQEELLAATLKPYLAFTQSGEVLLDRGFQQLETKRKILVLLLAVKALHLLGKRDQASASPTEIARLSGLPSGTIRRSVRELQTDNFLRSESGSYFVPAFSIRRVVDELTARGEGNESENR